MPFARWRKSVKGCFVVFSVMLAKSNKQKAVYCSIWLNLSLSVCNVSHFVAFNTDLQPNLTFSGGNLVDLISQTLLRMAHKVLIATTKRTVANLPRKHLIYLFVFCAFLQVSNCGGKTKANLWQDPRSDWFLSFFAFICYEVQSRAGCLWLGPGLWSPDPFCSFIWNGYLHTFEGCINGQLFSALLSIICAFCS